jgi:hypothetical protein
MRNARIERALTLLFPLATGGGPVERSQYERFALPYSFKPQLSFLEAVVAALGAFLRVLLGCLLFAVWGTYSLFTWSTIRNPFLRVGVQLPLFFLFAACFLLVMLVIANVVKAVSLRLP